MLNSYKPNNCCVCGKKMDILEVRTYHDERVYCIPCWENFTKYENKFEETDFNEPEHYHKFKIDTIQFLQEGFPPEVFVHFCQANIIKYTQRADYKNGREDILKVIDYAKRWLEWHDKTHS